MSFLKTNKILHHPDKLSEWYYSGDTSSPITVKVDLTNVCNHTCPGCIDHDLIADNNNSLSFELICSLLDEFRDLGIKAVNYTGGGEPTTHKAFADIIRETHKRGIEIGLICNGTMFHKLPMEELLSMFTWIRVSLDAYNSETHKRTHGPTANYDLTVNNLKNLVSIKQQQGLDVTLGAGYITHQYVDMDHDCWKFVEQCRDIGLDYAQLRPSFDKLYDYDSLTKKEWDTLINKVKKYGNNNFSVFVNEGKYKKIFTKNTTREYNSCHAQAFKSTTITAEGLVYMCCTLSSDYRGFIGSIKKDSFRDIWTGKTRKKALADLNVHKCPALCVGDSLNELLERSYKKEPVHKNFL